MVDYVFLTTLLPLAGFLINGIFGYKFKNERIPAFIGCGTVFVSFIISVVSYLHLTGLEESQRTVTVILFQWILTGQFNVAASYLIDPLSVVMCLIITGVGFLIHVYSIGYMRGDRGFARYFCFLNLFIFAMLNLVLADNFLLMFLGWEGVGLCSYLLIGFWYEKKFTGNAANKAFFVNRIGDAGFITALFFIFANFSSLNFDSVFMQISSSPVNVTLMTTIALLLFVGATGKSAQIPLYVWLPDAMAGPTPVSALIHAATMVTAGVYMIARCSIIYVLSPFAMDTVLFIGTVTALVAATIALAQNDIKKILAYSTISQLGYMFMAMGVGAFSAGIFHLTTHAFFKALMFLAAGSVIHAMHEEQDITKMGGLKNKLKVTFLTFLMGGIAISGIPPFSGFFSKDEILMSAYANGKYFYFVIGLLTAFLTAFYIFRLIALTFFGNPRYNESEMHPHESPKIMTVPLIILAFLSVIGGFLGLPEMFGKNLIEHFLLPVFAHSEALLTEHSLTSSTEITLMLVSAVVAVAAAIISYRLFSRLYGIPKFAQGALYRAMENKYYVDEFYDFIIVKPVLSLSNFLYSKSDLKVIDGIVNGTGKVFTYLSSDWRKIQTGVVQDYAVISIAGIIAIIVYVLFI
jgi:NADH-quinone oxidoreductase subunit L